ncbi:hypothetical protein EXM69_20465 [Clostridium botulinum]|uniref:Phage regulatory protein n=1 Tax=Clostridium botulinum TaxID=1491 RepID=A0A846I2J6_CLOBO|nr:hypothetical protein [Clostridium botulinum]
MNKLSVLNKKELTITSVELVDIINEFRKLEGNRAELQHKSFIAKIKNELETLKNLKISQQNIFPSNYIDSRGKQQPCYELTRDGMLQMLNSESALVRYKTVEYINKLESHIKMHQITNEEQFENIDHFKKEQLQLQFVVDMLKVNDGSKIKMLKEFNEAHNLTTQYLPDYTEEKITKSLSALIKEYKVPLSAIKMNNILIELGILEEKKELLRAKELKNINH